MPEPKTPPADLQADEALCAAIGSDLVANHAFMKEAEAEKTAALEGTALRDFYIHVI